MEPLDKFISEDVYDEECRPAGRGGNWPAPLHGPTYILYNARLRGFPQLAAGKAGIQVVKAPYIASSGQNCVRIMLALPLSQFDFTDSMKRELEAAVKQ